MTSVMFLMSLFTDSLFCPDVPLSRAANERILDISTRVATWHIFSISSFITESTSSILLNCFAQGDCGSKAFMPLCAVSIKKELSFRLTGFINTTVCEEIKGQLTGQAIV